MRITMKDSFDGVRNVEGKPVKIDNNTWRFKTTDGREVIRLHRTNIIEKLPNGRFVLDSGGWQSVTTKDRLNRFGPRPIFQKRYAWFVIDGDNVRPFEDGMTVG